MTSNATTPCLFYTYLPPCGCVFADETGQEREKRYIWARVLREGPASSLSPSCHLDHEDKGISLDQYKAWSVPRLLILDPFVTHLQHDKALVPECKTTTSLTHCLARLTFFAPAVRCSPRRKQCIDLHFGASSLSPCRTAFGGATH